ncbi:MAG: sulfatase-like hydrolase/transferase [Candidatus Sumerlaeota bacterium]|nr:sulfatase-like hydrolase/transferase [Candidatus Sumerlaeota bacterium]
MNYRRREFLKKAAALAAPFALPKALYGAQAKAAGGERPNVLLILTDQQNASMLSCAGNPWLKTPNMDSLAATGARFACAFPGNPVCVPSRWTMMSGVMPSRIGMDANRDEVTLPPEVMEHTLGRIFGAAGYETVYGGKVHLPGAFSDPSIYGFQIITHQVRNELAQICADWLRQKHERPFLMVASFMNPHDICAVLPANPTAGVDRMPWLAEMIRPPEGVSEEEFYRTLCPPLPENFAPTEDAPPALLLAGDEEEPDKPRRRVPKKDAAAQATDEQWRLRRWAYARLTEWVDANIGQVLTALRESGLAEKTLVAFASDHGEMDGAHHLTTKGKPYEEAIRVPFIVSWPGVTAAGRVDSTHLVSSGLDLIPTLCDFAGVSIPAGLKGRSVKPLATGGQVADWRTSLAIEIHGARGLRTERYMYAAYGEGEAPDLGEPREFLTDLKNDPQEMRNVARDPAYREALDTMRAGLVAWYKENGETLEPQYRINGEEAKDTSRRE